MGQVVRLLLRFVPYLKGYLLLQINPKYGYDTNKIVATAERKPLPLLTTRLPCSPLHLYSQAPDRTPLTPPGIVSMTQKIDPAFDVKRLCFKVISTWPGLQACRILEEKGVATLGTALFCMEQATLAGHVGCTYISPYYNELRVHVDKK